MNILLYIIMILHLPCFILDLIKLIYIGVFALISLATRNKQCIQYSFNNLLSVDQAVNCSAGGDKNETCSSRLGRYKNTVWLAKLICRFLDLFEKDHCIKSIVPEYDRNNEVIK